MENIKNADNHAVEITCLNRNKHIAPFVKSMRDTERRQPAQAPGFPHSASMQNQPRDAYQPSERKTWLREEASRKSGAQRKTAKQKPARKKKPTTRST